VKLPEPEFLGKHLLEMAPLLDADGLTVSVAGGGATDALTRP
jgi:amidophosphoribosyltransferase